MSIPLIFKTLELRNFLSFGAQTQLIELDGQGTVTVTGENIDQGGSSGACSNGAGKCLYPETRINVRVKGVKMATTIGELYEFARSLEA
ncbi:MAG: hypothetical protein DDT31_00920 [Syntrophomonadaceae bacterium]|nr:hypothetical protein [Bacillota bacterium]